MKAGIHPDYHSIEIVTTQGETIRTRSTWGKTGDVMTLDIDPSSHPAWTGKLEMSKIGRGARFRERYGKLF